MMITLRSNLEAQAVQIKSGSLSRCKLAELINLLGKDLRSKGHPCKRSTKKRKRTPNWRRTSMKMSRSI